MPNGASVRFWFLLYNVVLHLGLLLALPVWGWRRLSGRYRGQLSERLGRLPPDLAARFGARPALWGHAASAGETASAAPLIRRLKEARPDDLVLFTVTSKYGKEMAEKQLDGVVEGVAFSPFDVPWACRRVLRRVRPRLYLMVETDIWPNLIRLAKRRGARVVIASGHARAATFPRPFWRAVFAHVDAFLMQSDVDAKNIIARGAPADRVHTMGNLKFDSTGGVVGEAGLAELRADFGMPENAYPCSWPGRRCRRTRRRCSTRSRRCAPRGHRPARDRRAAPPGTCRGVRRRLRAAGTRCGPAHRRRGWARRRC